MNNHVMYNQGVTTRYWQYVRMNQDISRKIIGLEQNDPGFS